jgi:anthranilate synthase/aminodeoxychorismate synthase-like glutamine amidotransferase
LKVLLIDFYDSFTYNIHHYLIGLGAAVDVVEDRELDIDNVEHYEAIVFSPGPGLPEQTNSLFPVLERYAKSKKILGICLGMQGIAQFYGASIYNQKAVKHGVAESLTVLSHDNLFLSLPDTFKVGLYHSWAVDLNGVAILKEMARSEEGVTMAFKHMSLPVFGVQFHPESILTEYGKNILSNFLFN